MASLDARRRSDRRGRRPLAEVGGEGGDLVRGVLLDRVAVAEDERLEVEATHSGDGEWAATVTFSADGEWQWRVTHGTFETPPASTIAIAPASAIGLAPIGIAALATVALAIGVLLAGRRLRRAARPVPAGADVPAG